MRIGIEAQRIFRPKKHGMDVVAIELIRNLQEIDNKNEYFIFSRAGFQDNTITPTSNFHVEQFPANTYADWEQIKLQKAVSRSKLDLLHCTANTAPLYSPVPFILTLHDIIYLEKVDFKGTAYQNLGNLYRRWLVPKIVKKAGLILTVSEFERENIIKRLSLREEKVEVLYNGVSSKFSGRYTDEQLSSFLKKYRLPDRYIMFLGNTAPKKNTSGVIKAFADFCSRGEDDIQLVLLDYKKDFVLRILQDLGQASLLNRFVFPGYVDHNEIPLMYQAATIFLYPSLRESFGLPILEAMASGVPVITSVTSSMPEVAGNAAITIDPFNYKELSEAISRLVGDEALRKFHREKGLERAKMFTWKASAEKLLTIYERFRR